MLHLQNPPELLAVYIIKLHHSIEKISPMLQIPFSTVGTASFELVAAISSHDKEFVAHTKAKQNYSRFVGSSAKNPTNKRFATMMKNNLLRQDSFLFFQLQKTNPGPYSSGQMVLQNEVRPVEITRLDSIASETQKEMVFTTQCRLVEMKERDSIASGKPTMPVHASQNLALNDSPSTAISKDVVHQTSPKSLSVPTLIFQNQSTLSEATLQLCIQDFRSGTAQERGRDHLVSKENCCVLNFQFKNVDLEFYLRDMHLSHVESSDSSVARKKKIINADELRKQLEKVIDHSSAEKSFPELKFDQFAQWIFIDMFHSAKRNELGFSHAMKTVDLNISEIHACFRGSTIKVKFEAHMEQKGKGIMKAVIHYNSNVNHLESKIQALQLSQQAKSVTARNAGYNNIQSLKHDSYALLISGMFSAMKEPGYWQTFVVRLPIDCTEDDRQAIIKLILSRLDDPLSS
jgi:hypothetical protein